MKFIGSCIVVLCLVAINDRSGFAQTAGETLQVGPVVVTATRQEEEVMRIPSHITVITQEDVERSSATQVGDLLRTEAGLWVVNTSGSSPTSVFIDGRGFNNGAGNGSRVLVLVDGRRTNLVDTSNPDWATIPIEAVDRIEIVRGSSTALYGDNAVAGVINIIMKKGLEKPLTRLSLERGSYDSWNRKAAISGTDGSLSYFLHGGYETTNGYRENSDYQASNYNGNFVLKTGPASKLRIGSSYVSNERLLPGTLTEAEIESEGRRASVTDQDHGNTRQTRVDIGFDADLDPTQWLEPAAGQTVRGEDSRVTFTGAGSFNLDNDSRSTSLNGKYRIISARTGRENRMTWGVDLMKETVRAESTSDFFGSVTNEVANYERRLIGAYLHDEWSLHPAMILTLSGRMDWSSFEFSQATTGLSGDRSFRVWSPKTGLTYLLSPSANVFATWSKSVRFPNRDELTGFFGLTPQLDPEQAVTYEIGNTIRAGKIYEQTVTLYRTEVHDEILFIPPAIGNAAFGENQNVPEVKHEGVEASTMIRYRADLRLKATYTVTRTEIIEGPYEGGTLPITPKHAGSLTLDWGGASGWRLSLIGRFSGERILANDLANDQSKLSGFSVYDAKLQYVGENIDTFFSANNLFNKEYEESGGVGGFPFGSRIGFYPAPERNYYGGITVHY